MEKVLDRNVACLIQASGRGFFDLLVFEGETIVETVRNVSLKRAMRIAADKLQPEE